MNLRKSFGSKYSKTRVNQIIRYIGNSPERLQDLIDIYLEGPYRITQQAGWVLSYCVENNPGLAKPHLKNLLAELKRPDIKDAIKRNTMRLLQFAALPKRFHEEVINHCFLYL